MADDFLTARSESPGQPNADHRRPAGRVFGINKRMQTVFKWRSWGGETDVSASSMDAASMAQPQRSRRNTSAGSDMELTSFSSYSSRPMSASSLDPLPAAKPGNMPATHFSSPTPSGSRRVSNTSMGLHGHVAADNEDLNSVITQAGSACHSFSSLHSMLQDIEPHPAGDSPRTAVANPILEDPDQEARHSDEKAAGASTAAVKPAGDPGLPPRASRLSNDSSASLQSSILTPTPAVAGAAAARSQAGSVVDEGSLVPEFGSQHSASSLPSSNYGDDHGGPLVAKPSGAGTVLSKGLPPPSPKPEGGSQGGHIDDPLGAAAVAASGESGAGELAGKITKGTGSSNVIGVQAVAPGTGVQGSAAAQEAADAEEEGAEELGAELSGQENEEKAGSLEGTGGKGKPLKGAMKSVMSWGSGWGQKLQRNGSGNKASPANSQQELSSM